MSDDALELDLPGLGVIREADRAYTALKIVSVVYMVYLAWKIATAAPHGETSEAGSPLTFLQAALFQWINPNGWAMALTAISPYAPSQSMVALVFGAINLPSVSLWIILGQQMRRLLTNASRLRVFNMGMARLLIVAVSDCLFVTVEVSV
jgi:threonine/homoserine/homoserine lactone efflux protein